MCMYSNALFSLCWSVVRKVSLWKYFDLDHILIEGDIIYKSINKDDFLSVDELPERIQIYHCNVDIDIDVENLHEGVASHGEPFLRNILNVFDVGSVGYLLFICSYTIAIIPTYDRNGDLHSYFLFDSHCRNGIGITDVNGFQC